MYFSFSCVDSNNFEVEALRDTNFENQIQQLVFEKIYPELSIINKNCFIKPVYNPDHKITGLHLIGGFEVNNSLQIIDLFEQKLLMIY